MTIVLKPLGPGNWTPVLLHIDSSRNAPLPLEFHVGQRVLLGVRELRVHAILP